MSEVRKMPMAGASRVDFEQKKWRPDPPEGEGSPGPGQTRRHRTGQGDRPGGPGVPDGKERGEPPDVWDQGEGSKENREGREERQGSPHTRTHSGLGRMLLCPQRNPRHQP